MSQGGSITYSGTASATELVRGALSRKVSENNVNESSSVSKEDGERGAASQELLNLSSITPSRTPLKKRSFSDSAPKLSPSPSFRERMKQANDGHLPFLRPCTPYHVESHSRSLSLQVPVKDNTIHDFDNRNSLSPRSIYGSPTSVLPRHSRGLDFSRACTNLHHSTLAEPSSPECSPTVTQKSLFPPLRKGNLNYPTDGSISGSGSYWPMVGNTDRSLPSNSLSSVNMMDSVRDASSGSDDDFNPTDPGDAEDLILFTPHATKANNASAPTPFGGPSLSGSGPSYANNSPPVVASFVNYQRAKFNQKRRSRNSSSSASIHSTFPSPSPASPLIRHGDLNSNCYFTRDNNVAVPGSRRESLNLGTNDLHISSGNESSEEQVKQAPSTPGVVRRPVTRRGNLLPKTKTFSRIRAELLEETNPLDSEARREAEIVRQVRENETDIEPSRSSIMESPPLMPLNNSDIPGIGSEDNPLLSDEPCQQSTKGIFASFPLQASRGFSGKEFWNNYNSRMKTPPPPFMPQGSSSAMSDDISIDSPSMSASSASFLSNQAKMGRGSRSSTPQLQVLPTVADVAKKMSKRRRDDDFDLASFKRRAVSPGMSAQNSPVVAQSPVQRDGGFWSTAKSSRESSSAGQGRGERSGSTGSLTSMSQNPGPKRVGMQGITDTHDGLMKMSIE